LKRDDAEGIQLSNILLTSQGSTPLNDGSRNFCGLRLNSTRAPAAGNPSFGMRSFPEYVRRYGWRQVVSSLEVIMTAASER
jgi:hypothetical protein